MVRGAQSELPAVRSATSCIPTIRVAPIGPARGAEILNRTRSSIKCLVQGPRSPSSVPERWRSASWSPMPQSEPRCSSKVARALRRCSGACIIYLTSSTVESHVVPGRVRPGAGLGPSFGREVRYAKSQGESAVQSSRVPLGGLRRPPHNKSLLRAVTHQVLRRGRGRAAPEQAHRARVLMGCLAAAELSR